MAPPTRLRPHLNDLLQKNLELEHVVADLRHQLTQSFAKWADERKTLATGCDALMASFAKFRARLDVHPSDLGDSEGEVERNLDALGQNEEAGEADNLNGMPETEGDQASSVADDLRERCHALAAELQVKEEELEESRRKHEAAEEELQRVQRSFEEQSEQLREVLSASSKGDSSSQQPPERPSDGTPVEADPSKKELQDTSEKLKQETSRLKQLLQQWQKYGNDWKGDAQSMRTRASEAEQRVRQLTAQVKASEDAKALLEKEEKETQRLNAALADQTAAVEQERKAYQESLNRIRDLENTVSLLRAQLSPEQLASFDLTQQQVAPEPSNPVEPPTSRPDTNTAKRSDMIVLKIPYLPFSRPSWANKPVKSPSREVDGSQDDQQNQAAASSSVSTSPVPQTNNNPPSYNSTDFELCIHTCNTFPCRNESQSFLWPRKQASLPRHALSSKKHRRCAPDCPGNRLLMMTVAEAMKEPRRAKCRPPTELELATANEEVDKQSLAEPTGEQGTDGEGETRREGLGEGATGDGGEGDEASSEEEGVSRKVGEEELSQKAGEGPSRKSDTSKRLRSRLADGEDSQRARKLRRRNKGNVSETTA